MAQDTFETAGTIQDWKPAGDKGPGRALVGGLKVKVWPTERMNGEQVGSLAYKLFKQAAEGGKPIKVSGRASPATYNGRNFTEYTVEDVSEPTPEEVAAGDAKNAGKAGGRAFVPRDDHWLAARWAISSALDTLPEGTDPLSEKAQERISATAQYLLGKSIELEGFARDLHKAQGDAATSTGA